MFCHLKRLHLMICHQPNIHNTMSISVMAFPSLPNPLQLLLCTLCARLSHQMVHIFGSVAYRHPFMGRELFFCCAPAVKACLAMLSYSVLPYAMHVLCYAMLCRAVPCAALLCSPWDSS